MIRNFGKLVVMTGLIGSTFAAVPAYAEAWKIENDKGLVIHNLNAAPFQLTLVCDPDGAFIPPQNYMLVKLSGKELKSGTLEVEQGDETASLKIEAAAILAKNDAAEWNAATNLLFAGGAVTLKADAKELRVELEPVSGNPCLPRG